MATDPYRARHRPGTLPPRLPLEGRAPRVLAHVHMYPPIHNAGAEMMLHAMLVDLTARGWEAEVVAAQYDGDPYVLDGVRVHAAPGDIALGDHYEQADVVVTHLDVTRHAIAWARRGRPLVHIVHNHRQLDHHRVRPGDCSLAVWNSEWVAGHYPGWPGRSMIVRPPVSSHHYATPRTRQATRVTLLNLNEQKGGPLLFRLARQRPDLRFLAVRGAYGGQEVPAVVPGNVLVADNTPNARGLYTATRVLLVPSAYESWGRVAVEAMASGIPIVAHPTPGLLESCTLADGRPAVIFADRDSDQQWLDALRQLDDPHEYNRWAGLARQRSGELDAVTAADLDAFAAAMWELATPRA